MRNVRPLTWALALILISVLGLGLYSSAKGLDDLPAPRSTVQPTVRSPGPSPTPLACTQNSPNMSLQIVLKPQSDDSFQGIQVEGKGFMPKEKLYIVIEGHGINNSVRNELFDFLVNADGSFTDTESLQLAEPKMRWQVFVVHQRGVACGNFTTGQ